MGDIIQLPLRNRRLRIVATGELDGARGAFSASTCDGYALLIDDLLARHRTLACGLPRWGDTPELWLDDAKALIAEIQRRPANVRMAVNVATLLGELRVLANAAAIQSCDDICESDFGIACLAEAAEVNADLKARLVPVPTDCTTRADLAPAAREAEHVSSVLTDGAGPMAATARARHSGAIVLEACSAVFHGRAMVAALRAMARAVFNRLRIPADLLRHDDVPGLARAPERVERKATLEAHAVRVIRKELSPFRPEGGAA